MQVLTVKQMFSLFNFGIAMFLISILFVLD